MAAEATAPGPDVTPAAGITHVPAPVTQAQKLAGLVGLVLLAAGSLGFIASSSFDTGTGLDHGSLLGFEVNGWSNIAHLAAGLLLLAAAASRAATRAAWRTIAFAALVALIAGLIDGDDIFGLVPVNTADHIADAALLVIALAGTRMAKEDRGILERDRLVGSGDHGPDIVGPGSGSVGGPRRNVARIDARL
ncbi:MAG TPA: DUF4383 domain-containing protein [Solirubrobacteraceae bacterium]|nr:DUF4383 domain-containing protein [Solirubrobacteraceae bacterium]